MEKKLFGTLYGEEIYSYKISDGKNISAEIITFGGIIKNLTAFGVSVVGGFDTLDSYIKDTSHQGGIIGRVANRIENARFAVDGIVYEVTKNNNGNCLHGGRGFDRRVWTVESYSESSITLSYVSPRNDEGFPGEITTNVTYTVIGDALMIEYSAVADEKTPISLTNHSYFNLDGFGGDIKSHYIKLYANRYTEVDERLIPVGRNPKVDGTPFDLRERVQIGKDFSEEFTGYDHNFRVEPREHELFNGKELGLIAEVDNERIKLSVYTDQLGVQFYTSNFLGGGELFSGGIAPIKHGAFCLETQCEPNCVAHGVSIYEEGEEYTHNTVYKFERIGGI